MKYTLTVPGQKDEDEISTSKSLTLESPLRTPSKGYWYRKQASDEINDEYEDRPVCKPSCVPISLILLLIVLVVLLPLLDGLHTASKLRNMTPLECSKCNIQLTESIPDGLIYPNNSVRFMSTFDSWDMLIQSANSTIEIGSFYWTLRGKDININHTSAWEGERIFNLLLDAGTRRNISVRIAQSQSSDVSANLDTIELQEKRAAEVRSVDFPKLLGGGVLHTKLILIDRKDFYVGSANMDWRALTEVKELGVLVRNCPCLANDILKIFNVYWMLGKDGAKIPPKWPAELSTSINKTNPLNISFQKFDANVYISSSPAPLSPTGRTSDIDAILNTIAKAEKYVYVSVMDYIPSSLYTKHVEFWPLIDDALRRAAIERNVRVRLLVSHWKHSRQSIDHFLQSLADLSNAFPDVSIEVKRFIVPSNPDQDKIPFGRVNHNKYIVTERTAVILTSNLSKDYFVNTAGIGFYIEDQTETSVSSIKTQLTSIFDRDWYSPYAVQA